MKIVKKALYSTLMLACATMITSVQAQTTETTSKPRAVLFKLHDIKPVMNEEGLVTHCDFMATFYNRTEDGLRPAKLELGWNDNVTSQYNLSENKEVEPVNNNVRNTRYPMQEKIGEVSTMIDIPALGSYKQVAVKASVKTEKCFLLLDNLNFRVSDCGLVGKQVNTQVSNGGKSGAKSVAPTECANLFEYINSTNPEYYDEFKNISYSEQERLILDDRKKDVSDLEKAYNTVIENFGKAEETIKKIQ